MNDIGMSESLGPAYVIRHKSPKITHDILRSLRKWVRARKIHLRCSRDVLFACNYKSEYDFKWFHLGCILEFLNSEDELRHGDDLQEWLHGKVSHGVLGNQLTTIGLRESFIPGSVPVVLKYLAEYDCLEWRIIE